MFYIKIYSSDPNPGLALQLPDTHHYLDITSARNMNVFFLKPILYNVSNFCWWHLHSPCHLYSKCLVIFDSFLFCQTLVSSIESTLKYPSHLPFLLFPHPFSCISGLHYLFTYNSYLTKKNLFTSTLKSTAKLIFMSYRLKNFPMISAYQIKSNLSGMPVKIPNKPYCL